MVLPFVVPKTASARFKKALRVTGWTLSCSPCSETRVLKYFESTICMGRFSAMHIVFGRDLRNTPIASSVF